MLKSSLCDYSDAYILVKGTISVNNTDADGAVANNTNKKVIFKNCAPFTNCLSKINNTQIDNAKDIDIVMSMYNLIECSNNYEKTAGSLCQYCKDIPALNANDKNVQFTGGNTVDSFNFKSQVKLEMMEQKKHSETVDNPSIRMYINRIENRITFKIKNGYYLELLTPGAMKLLGSTESKITKDKNGENVPHLEVVELVLVHCNLVNNDYQQDSRVLYQTKHLVVY